MELYTKRAGLEAVKWDSNVDGRVRGRFHVEYVEVPPLRVDPCALFIFGFWSGPVRSS